SRTVNSAFPTILASSSVVYQSLAVRSRTSRASAASMRSSRSRSELVSWSVITVFLRWECDGPVSFRAAAAGGGLIGPAPPGGNGPPLGTTPFTHSGRRTQPTAGKWAEIARIQPPPLNGGFRNPEPGLGRPSADHSDVARVAGA